MPAFTRRGQGEQDANNESGGGSGGSGGNEIIEALRPFEFHGLHFNSPKPWESQARADCPFCGKECKFHVAVKKEKERQWDCLSGDTKILTRQMGYVPIRSVSGTSVEILTPDGWQHCPIRSGGKQFTYAITMTRDQKTKVVFATANHRWILRTGSEKTTADLRPGDRLAHVTAPMCINADPIGIRHGIMYGDGNNRHVELCGSKIPLTKYMDPGKISERSDTPNGVKRIRVNGQNDKFHKLPAISASEEYLLGFLQGYFSTDGTTAHGARIDSSQKSDIEFVREACAKVGLIASPTSETWRKGFPGHEGWMYYTNIHRSSLTPDFFIRDDQREQFISKGNCSGHVRASWRVVSVDPHMTTDVHCAVVKGSEAFALEDNLLTGNCKSCGARGNLYTFLQKMWELFRGVTSREQLQELADERGILYADTLVNWGVAWSHLLGEWVVPAYNGDGKLVQLYRYTLIPGGKKRALFASPGLNAGMFGPQEAFKKKCAAVDVCEGPWDGMAYEEVLQRTKQADDGTLTQTGNIKVSLLAKRAVVATPGANTFLPSWCVLFGGRAATLLYDNDHERENPQTKQKVDGAALAGIKRAAGVLGAATTPTSELRYLDWSGSGKQWNSEFPSGTDLRDLFSQETDLQGRIGVLSTVIQACQPILAEWVQQGAGGAHGKVTLDPLACEDWQTLETAWKRAMEWTEGLRGGLICMLATTCAVPVVGEQLWMKIVGPPSCLDGNTPIHDPIDGTTKTVQQRYEDGANFFVYTRKPDRVGIAQALPPQKYPKTSMYEVVFKSGRRIRTTGGHRFWTGDGYVALHTIARELRACGAFHLPSISEFDLSARLQDVLRSSQTTPSSRCDYRPSACSCGGQLQTVVDNDQYAAPSQCGAPARIPKSFDTDGLVYEETHSHRSHQHVPLSNSSEMRLEQSLLSEDGLQYHVEGDTSSPSLSLRQQTLRPETLTHPSRKRLSSSESGLQTTDDWLFPPRLHAGRNPRLMMSPSDVCNTERSNVRPGSRQLSRPSEIETLDASPQFEFVYHGGGDISGRLASQLASSHKPLQESARTHTDGWPLGYDPRSMQEFPSLVPLKVVNCSLGSSILSEFDEIVSVVYVGEYEYFDFSVPETQNYWAEGLFHHNCGKSTLCEATSVARKWVFPKDTFSGLFSGYQTDKEGSQNLSMVLKIDGKTLAIKDADTILQHPNKAQILSQFRGLYDRSFRTQYNNKMSVDHDNVSTGVLLCGTSSLRVLDDSELGQRFLDYEIMSAVDPRLEEKINASSLNNYRAIMASSPLTNGDGADSPDKAHAKRLTGGYVEYLRNNIERLVRNVQMSDEALDFCNRCGKFVAYFRSRPSGKQTEEVHRELSTRLVLQFAKLAYCVTVVLNKDHVDQEVLNLVRGVALCTARGRTLDIGKFLYVAQDLGAETKGVSVFLGESDDVSRKLLRFLKRIGVVEQYGFVTDTGMKRWRWRLTTDLRGLYGDLIDPDGSLLEQYGGYM